MGVLAKYGIIGIVLHLISPILFIWSINTLFNLGIPFTFKTWLAGLVLIYVVRFHMRLGRLYESVMFTDSWLKRDQEADDSDEDEEVEESDEKAKAADERLDEKLLRYKREKERQRRKKR
jgi:hypothetical protein